MTTRANSIFTGQGVGVLIETGQRQGVLGGSVVDETAITANAITLGTGSITLTGNALTIGTTLESTGGAALLAGI